MQRKENEERDTGFFGPDSIAWKINRETTVLFGGAKALLMHAAHPLIAAGARQTGGYKKNPWVRLLRTLQLQNLVTFGTKAEALSAADRINRLHEKVNGTDPVTFAAYDALDPDLLLWVHACLEICSVEFYEMTVRPLSDSEKEQYHTEAKTAAELVLLPSGVIPDTTGDLNEYVDSVLASGVLRKTDVSEDVASLLKGNPPEWTHRPIWNFISFAAFQTLPGELKKIYGVKGGTARKTLLNVSFKALSFVRPVLPLKHRVILPARIAEERLATGKSFRMEDYL